MGTALSDECRWAFMKLCFWGAFSGQDLRSVTVHPRALGQRVVGALFSPLGQGFWCNQRLSPLSHTWALAGGQQLPSTSREEGGPPLAFCITAAHALAWALQAGLGLHQGPVLASDQLGHLLFILGRARSWHGGLKGCQHFIFRDRKMLAFWQLLLF